MRPPRLRCTLFPLIYPPHLLGSYKRQLYGFVLFSRLTKRNLASYVISVRRTKSLLTASFRFYLTIDTLAVQLYTSLSPRRVRDFHPLERAHGAQTKNKHLPPESFRQLQMLYVCISFYSLRRASIGLRLAAFTDGRSPKIRPISMENTTEPIIAGTLMAVGAPDT